jgi:hypothetical protein
MARDGNGEQQEPHEHTLLISDDDDDTDDEVTHDDGVVYTKPNITPGAPFSVCSNSAHCHLPLAPLLLCTSS